MTTDQTPDRPTAEIQDQPTAEVRDQPTAEFRWAPVHPGPDRPSGPHWPAVVLGVVCLVIAALALGQGLGRFTVDWGNLGPLGIVAVGGVLVLVGLVGLMGRRRDETRADQGRVHGQPDRGRLD